MASAQRVAQDAKVEGGFSKEHHQEFRVYTVNGNETTRVRIREHTSVVDNRRSVLQPDRIQLDLSLDEAETLTIIAAMIGGAPEGRRGVADEVWRALKAVGCPILTFHPDVNTSISTALHFGRTASGLHSPHPSTNGKTAASSVKDSGKAVNAMGGTPYQEPHMR